MINFVGLRKICIEAFMSNVIGKTLIKSWLTQNFTNGKAGNINFNEYITFWFEIIKN